MAEESDLEKLDLSVTSLPQNESEAEKFGIETQTIFKDFPPIIKK